MSEKKKTRYSGIGGQAVLEGVMMKNKEKYAVAVRKPNGQIEVKVEETKDAGAGGKWKQLPFIRGVFNFVDSLMLGTKCLTYSASFYEEEEEVKEESKFDKALGKMFGGKAEDVIMGITVCISLVMAVLLFMILPYFLTELLGRVVANSSLLALFEALVRVFIFILYVILISLMKDIQRVYMYHGAEHKCINCVERGRELTVENVMKSSRLHKRCGTSFLLFVVFVSAVFFFFIRVDNVVLKVALRLLLLPVIAGISYELIRLAGKYDNAFTAAFSYPGMLLQKLTTKEPDADMVEVAIASVEAVFDWKAYFKETFGYDVDSASRVQELDEEELDQMEDTLEDVEISQDENAGAGSEDVESEAEKEETQDPESETEKKEAQDAEGKAVREKTEILKNKEVKNKAGTSRKAARGKKK